MELVDISSMAIEGPNDIAVKVRLNLDMEFEELQTRLLKEDIDPLDPGNIQQFMPLLKEHLDMSPFTVNEVVLSNVSQATLTVVVDLSVTVKQEIKDVKELLKQYEGLLRAKVALS